MTIVNSDASATVYIDPNRIDPYLNAFGAEKGLNYLVYHEISHALEDMRKYDTHADREKITNEYGQVLAELTGAAYPDDTQLLSVGGTVAR